MNQHVKFVAVAAALAAMLTLIVAESVYAQAPVKLAGGYPAKPIRVVVPFPAGGAPIY